MKDNLERQLDFHAAFEAGKQAGAMIDQWDGTCPYRHRKLRAAWSNGFVIARMEAGNAGPVTED